MKIIIRETQLDLLKEDYLSVLFDGRNGIIDGLIMGIKRGDYKIGGSDLSNYINIKIDEYKTTLPRKIGTEYTNMIYNSILNHIKTRISREKNIMFEKIIEDLPKRDGSLNDIFLRYNKGFMSLEYFLTFLAKYQKVELKRILENLYEKPRTGRVDFANIEKQDRNKYKKEPVEKIKPDVPKPEVASFDVKKVIKNNKDRIKLGQEYHDIEEIKGKIVGFGSKYSVHKTDDGEKEYTFKNNGVIDKISKDGDDYLIDIFVPSKGKLTLKKNINDGNNYYWTKYSNTNPNNEQMMVNPYLFRYLKRL